jgi:hypothetical protein
MAAVDDRAEASSGLLPAVLDRAAADVARELAVVWAAYGRFCRTRAGVPPETMLAAWGLPLARDVTAMLAHYPGVEADPAAVERYFDLVRVT